MMHREYEAKRFNGTKTIDLGEVSHIDCEASDLLLMTDYEHCLESTSKYGLQELVFKLSKALNPPIKVTQAVLDAMEKVPEASFWYVEGSVNVRLKWDEILKTFTVNGQTLSITDYIQADCPLALQVLFQFNTEGQKYA